MDHIKIKLEDLLLGIWKEEEEEEEEKEEKKENYI